jgi:TfoX/Sxy family transcriptional regulator of competence genes
MKQKAESGATGSTWKKSPTALIERFTRIVGALPSVEIRKMFGYPAGFVNGYNFAGLFEDSMVIRLSPEDMAAFMQLPGASPFEPMPGRKMGGYASVPSAMLDAESDLLTWLERAVEFAHARPPKPVKQPAKKATKSSKPERA